MQDYVSDPAHHYEADPQLTARIINQMKSKGSFDQLRKEILADIDTKPAYQNLRQKVENTVIRFLKNQKWNSDLVKNKLRDSLKRHLTEGNYVLVAPVLNQVLTPDLCSQVAPEVDKEICKELGLPEDEEEPAEQSPNNRRRDGGWDGEGGSGHGFRGQDSTFRGDRHNGRAWGHENGFFYPYRGGFNRFNRRGGHRDADDASSSEDEHSVSSHESTKIEENKPDKHNMSQFDEMDFEYSKEEVVELNRKENPDEAQKWAIAQLAAQKLKIEEELRRIELAEQQKNLQPEIVEQLPEKEEEEMLEEPKTPEMSDGEDSDVPEMQIVEEDSRSESKDSTDVSAPTGDAKIQDSISYTPKHEPSYPTETSEPDLKEPEPDIPSTPEIKAEPVSAELETLKETPTKEAENKTFKEPDIKPDDKKSVAKLEDVPREKPKEESSRRKSEDKSRRDDRHKSDNKKEHSSSSSSSSSSKRHHSTSSSKSSSHKSSSSSRHESSKSSSSRSRDDSRSSSSSHRSSSRKDSDRHKSSSSSSSSRSHRRDDKYRSRSSSHKKGEDTNNLYFFTNEQALELVRNRAYLDEVMIRLEIENSGGYESLLSESEEEDTTVESFTYNLDLEYKEAVGLGDILGIDIPGVDEGEEEEPLLEEINANEIIKSTMFEKVHIKRRVNGGWNHVNSENENTADSHFIAEDMSTNKRLSVVLDKCPEAELKNEIASQIQPAVEEPVPVKRKRIVRKIEQRYSTDDLYKPRTTFTSSRRSRE